MNGTADGRAGVTVVGGGIAGLTAAIVAAEAGARVELHELAGTLGGRARTTGGPFRANYGPHAVYADGPTFAWLKARDLLPELVRPKATGFFFGRCDRLRRLPRHVGWAAIRLGADAPDDEDFRRWATRRAGHRAAEAAIGVASLPTFHHDPGRLSAAFVAPRFARVVRKGSATRYVVGGWAELIATLERRARELDVEVRTTSAVRELPSGPVVVALSREAAQTLLGEPLAAGEARVGLLDLGLERGRRWPAAVIDLERRAYVSRPSASVPGLAPEGIELVQASAGLAPGEELDAGVRRIEAVLDYALPGWRGHEVWRRRSVSSGGTGAIEEPGRSWRDRPAVDRGDGVFLAGDYVAAPGLLSEVAHASAVEAGAKAAAWARSVVAR